VNKKAKGKKCRSDIKTRRYFICLQKCLCWWQVVNRYIDEGVAELVPGVLFIDEVTSSLTFSLIKACNCIASI